MMKPVVMFVMLCVIMFVGVAVISNSRAAQQTSATIRISCQSDGSIVIGKPEPLPSP